LCVLVKWALSCERGVLAGGVVLGGGGGRGVWLFLLALLMLSERVFAEASRRVVHELRGLECLARIRIASGR